MAAQQLSDATDGSPPRFDGKWHLRFIAPLCEDIEAAWEPVMPADMHEIEFEGDLEHPKQRIADPPDVVAYVQLSTADREIALRVCYLYRTLIPVLPRLAEIGRRGSV